MIIFHGSKNIISKPIYGEGNMHNDYGQGFYCTENIELGKEWACSYFEVDGFVNCYEIDLTNFKILDLRDKKYSILNWLAILLKHRTFEISNPISFRAREYIIGNFYIDVDEYDIIIGFRADDSYFSFAKDFINNNISFEQLEIAMSLGELGEQIVIKSKKAFEAIKFINYEKVNSNIYFPLRVNRDEKARMKYLYDLRFATFDDLFISDIIRKGLRNDYFLK